VPDAAAASETESRTCAKPARQVADDTRHMEAIKAESAVPSRFITVLMTTFGGSALALAAVASTG